MPIGDALPVLAPLAPSVAMLMPGAGERKRRVPIANHHDTNFS
jgi:hypothetical protein